MKILEMVQLQSAHPGMGLLPFIPIGAAFVVLLMKIHTRTRTNYAILTMHFYFWILLAVFSAAKLHILRTDHHNFKRRGSKYPTADQIMDCVVILAMVAVSTVVTALTPSVTGPGHKAIQRNTNSHLNRIS